MPDNADRIAPAPQASAEVAPASIAPAWWLAFVSWVHDVLAMMRITRMPLLISLSASIFLALPPQTLEVYRLLVQSLVMDQLADEPDLTTTTAFSWLRLLWNGVRNREVVLGVLCILIMSICLWYMAAYVTLSLRGFYPHDSRTVRAIATWAPRVIGTLPLLAFAFGIYRAGSFVGLKGFAGAITDLQIFAPERVEDQFKRLCSVSM